MARKRSMRQICWENGDGTCYLCGIAVQVGLEPDDPLAYTVDHVIPRALGGINDPSNMAVTHRFCNAFKEDSLLEDLPQGYRRFLKWKIKNMLVNRSV